MLKDITIGQYYPSKSVMHRLDARVKIVGTLIFIISLFVFDSFYGYIAASALLISCIAISKVPVKFMLRGLKTIFLLLFLTVVINMFMVDGEPLITVWKITISKEGFKAACFMALRLIFLIVGSSLMTLTTTPNNLTDAIEKLLKPLSKIRVPVHEIAMMMSIALSFIPILIEETDKIIKAQTARCADFENKNIIKRIKSYIPVLVPLFVSAFRRATELALAMEARCYKGGDGRTKMKPLKYVKRDYIAYTVLLSYMAIVIALGILL